MNHRCIPSTCLLATRLPSSGYAWLCLVIHFLIASSLGLLLSCCVSSRFITRLETPSQGIWTAKSRRTYLGGSSNDKFLNWLPVGGWCPTERKDSAQCVVCPSLQASRCSVPKG